MANLTITDANVQLSSDSVPIFDTAGEALGKSMPVYQSETDMKWYKSESGDTVTKAAARGITFTSAAADAKVGICVGGSMIIGATLALNTLYVVSATSGLICPIADLVSTDWVSPLFISKSTTVGSLIVQPQGFQIP